MNDVFSIECTNMPMALDENMIFFVERGYEFYINEYIGRNSKRFVKAFSSFDYSFNYLPESKDLELFLICRQILNASKDVNMALCKYAYMDNGRAVFYCVELDNDEKEESLAKQFYHFACWCKVDVQRRAKWKQFDEEFEELMRIQREELKDCWQCNEDRPKIQIVTDWDNLEELEEFFVVEEDVKETVISSVDVQLADIARQLDELRRQGVSEERIREAIDPKPELTPLHITSDLKIMLPALNKEIVLQPINKAVFLLFLRHPKGINFKDMADYKEELINLYVEVTDRIDLRVIGKSINSLCNPLSNSIHEKCTRIREVFVNCLGEELASNYCIVGKKGEDKRIPLPEEMIVWE